MAGIIGGQKITERYAAYEGDCISVMAKLPKESVHLSVYSPPFGGLYQYTSDERKRYQGHFNLCGSLSVFLLSLNCFSY